MTSKTAIEDIAAERLRQVEREGFTRRHDAEHADGELAAAAEGYLASAISRVAGEDISDPPEAWSFEPGWWKPKSYYEDLTRSAALIAAEMDRVLHIAEWEGHRCEACRKPLYTGDPYYPDHINGGAYHAHCLGPELESFTDEDGNPLPPGSPIPAPSRYEV